METPGIPFLCQWDLKRQDEPSADFCEAAGIVSPPLGWAERSCGIACVSMVLSFWGRDAGMSVLLHQALEIGAWGGERNWRHTQLVALLARHGLIAWRRNWRLLEGRENEYLDGRLADDGTPFELDRVRDQMIDEGLHSLGSVLDSGLPVIASVYRPAWNRRSPGHMIVLIGWQGGELRYHDPAERDGANRRISVSDFRRRWKGTAIFTEPGWTDKPLVSPRTG